MLTRRKNPGIYDTACARARTKRRALPREVCDYTLKKVATDPSAGGDSTKSGVHPRQRKERIPCVGKTFLL